MPSLLLVLPQLFDRRDGVLEVETQSANGLRLYGKHFDRVTAVGGERRDRSVRPPSLTGVPAEELAERLGVELVPLPRLDGYRNALRDLGPLGLRREKKRIRGTLARLIDEHDVLQFTPSRLVDDWGGLAATIARQKDRSYAVHTDAVQERMVIDQARGKGLGKLLQARVYSPLLRRSRRRTIGGAALGMLHGADCHAAYSELPARSELVHDIHTSPDDAIDDDAFEAKLAEAADPGRRLRVGYAGRVAVEKGPLDWIAALAEARRLGADFEAIWVGDGDLSDALRAGRDEHGLTDRIELPGFTADRAGLLATLRRQHLFLFCHKVPESPRCLIEALVSGTPLLGYDSAYSRDLTGDGTRDDPAGRHVPRHDATALGAALAGLAADRPALVRLLRAARTAGRDYNDEAVFEHRCDTLKQHLG